MAWPDLEQRFFRKIRFDPSTECWVWIGAHVGGGYGCMSIGRRSHRAHRVAYRLFLGPIPEGLELDHLCRNRACCNPAHLEPVTHQENMRRAPSASWVPNAVINSAKTHCKHAHEFTPENTYIHPRRGTRHCRACHRAASRRHYGRKVRRGVAR